MGGSTTTTNSSSPPPQFLQAYTDLINRATGIANQPLQQYSGDIVAGLSPDQQAGIAAVQNGQGVQNQFINDASDLYGEAGAPITTNAGGIASGAGQATTSAAGAAGVSATTAANNGAGIAVGGAMQGASAANQAAGTNVWNQLPGVSQGISDWMTPYTQQVVDATQAQFNNQNAQAQQGQLSSAIKQGAFGGDRSGVAQAILAGQQQTAQAPVIAGLYNNGFQSAAQNYSQDKALQANVGSQRASLMAGTALQGGSLVSNAGIGAGQLGANTALGAGSLNTNAANQAGQLELQGSQQQLSADQASRAAALNSAQGIAALGSQAQSSGLADAQSLLGIGQLEQNQQQAQLNVPYQQFQQQQAYPFQTQQFLNQAVTGAGANAGGTSSSTTPGPNAGSQILGAGLGIAGLFLNRGGAVPRRAAGGGIGDVPDLSISYIPEVKNGVAVGGGGPPKPPEPAPQEDPVGDSLKMLGDAAGKKAGKYAHTGIAADPHPSGFETKDWVADHPATGAIDWDSVKMPDFEIGMRRGGAIVPYRAEGGGIGGKVMPHLSTTHAAPAGIAAGLTKNYGNAAADAQGHSTAPHSTYYPDVDPWWSHNPGNQDEHGNILPGLKNPTVGTPFNNAFDPSQLGMGSIFKRGGGVARRAPGGGITEEDLDDPDETAMLDASRREDIDEPEAPEQAAESTLPEPPAAAGIGDASDMDGPYTHYPIDDQPADAETQVASASGIADDGYRPREIKDTSVEDKKQTMKMSLLAAGLGMMAGRSHNFGANIGTGGLEGLKTFSSMTSQDRAREEKRAEMADTGQYHKWSLKQQAKHFSDTIDMQREWHKQAGTAAQTRAEAAAAKVKADAHYREQLLEQGNWQIVTDPMTGKQTMMNKKTGEKKDPKDVVRPDSGGGSGAPAAAASSPDAAPGLTPSPNKRPAGISPDVPQSVVDEAAAIYNYDQAPPNGFSRTKPYGMGLMNVVRAMGAENKVPYDEQFYKISQANRQKFTGGKQGDSVKSFNVALSHLSTLQEMHKALMTGDTKAFNRAKNFLSDQFGGVPIGSYDAAHKLVTDEATKAVIGSAGGVADRDENAKAAASASSQKQVEGQINAFRGLMVGQLHGLKRQYEFGTRRKDFDGMLDDEAKALLKNPQFQAGKDPNANQPQALPVIAGADGRPSIDRSKIDPNATYNTKQGAKLGKDIIGAGP